MQKDQELEYGQYLKVPTTAPQAAGLSPVPNPTTSNPNL